MRLILCLALLALACVATASTKPDGAPSQLIDKSVITYPRSLGRYSLVEGTYDPARVADGVSLHYDLADAPHDLRFNIYVYPLGRIDTNKAVTDATIEMEGEIRTLEQKKEYADLKFSDAVAFDVAAPPSNILKTDHNNDAPGPDARPAKGSPAATEPVDNALLDALHETEPLANTTGRKRALTLSVRGTPSESLAYVFYRNLFLISVRATAPISAIPNAEFNVLIDRAVKDLVPRMDIQNFGDCGTVYVSVGEKSGDKDKDAKAVANQLVRAIGRVARENCSSKPTPDTAPPAGLARQTIVYPAGMWK